MRTLLQLALPLLVLAPLASLAQADHPWEPNYWLVTWQDTAGKWYAAGPVRVVNDGFDYEYKAVDRAYDPTVEVNGKAYAYAHTLAHQVGPYKVYYTTIPRDKRRHPDYEARARALVQAHQERQGATGQASAE